MRVRTNTVDIDVSTSSEVDIDLSIDDMTFDLAKQLELYTGEYIVTPAWEEQELDTAYKRMKHGVTVLEIPVSTVTNAAGGETVTIG